MSEIGLGEAFHRNDLTRVWNPVASIKDRIVCVCVFVCLCVGGVCVSVCVCVCTGTWICEFVIVLLYLCLSVSLYFVCERVYLTFHFCVIFPYVRPTLCLSVCLSISTCLRLCKCVLQNAHVFPSAFLS